jgi:polyhydroxybutyrate depolymerase
MKLTSHLIFLFSFAGITTLEAQYFNYNHDGVARQYIYYEPEELSANSPLVFVMHGYSGDAYSIESYAEMNAVADQYGFAVCYPRGTKDEWGNRFWNVGYEFHEGMDVDDAGFLIELAGFLQTEHTLDASRTFATGMSNGGDMSFFLACEAPEIFRAVAPVCGTIMTENFDNCTETIPVFAISGTEDDVTWYDGDPGNIGEWGPYLGIPAIIDHFSTVNGCTDFSSEALPNINPGDGSTVTFERYFEGIGENEVWLYRVEGGGHDWPGASGNMDINASEAIWQFFSQFPVETPLDIEETNKQSLPEIFPNPSNGTAIHLNYDITEPSLIYIADLSGRVVFSQKLDVMKNPTISLPKSLKSGIYTLGIKGSGSIVTKQFIVNQL